VTLSCLTNSGSIFSSCVVHYMPLCASFALLTQKILPWTSCIIMCCRQIACYQKWVGEVEKSTNFLTPNMIAAMGQVQLAGVSDSESEDDAADDNNDEQSYSLGEEDNEVDSDNETNGDIVERQVVLCLDIPLLKHILLTADIAVLQSLDRTYSHGSGYAVLDKAAGKVDPRLLPCWIYSIT
jgi:hypothetical protein